MARDRAPPRRRAALETGSAERPRPWNGTGPIHVCPAGRALRPAQRRRRKEEAPDRPPSPGPAGWTGRAPAPRRWTHDPRRRGPRHRVTDEGSRQKKRPKSVFTLRATRRLQTEKDLGRDETWSAVVPETAESQKGGERKVGEGNEAKELRPGLRGQNKELKRRVTKSRGRTSERQVGKVTSPYNSAHRTDKRVEVGHWRKGVRCNHFCISQGPRTPGGECLTRKPRRGARTNSKSDPHFKRRNLLNPLQF